MAGLSGPQRIVDVVAASEKLLRSAADQPPPEQAAPPEPETAPAPAGALADCPLGHPNPLGAVYCGSCGLRMDARIPAVAPERPRPAAELSAAERAERDAAHAEALAAAARFEQAPERLGPPSAGEAVLIHFTEDGLTVFGRVWYRGQELAIGPDHPRWPEAVGWITMNRWEQYERWGRQFFDAGPWPGRRSYVDPAATYEKLGAPGGGQVDGPSEEQLRAADEAEARRGRRVPAPSF